MDAILFGFRAQVDVKGKLAELYLYHHLQKLEKDGVITKLEWLDEDGKPDFYFICNGKSYRLECKNVRNEMYQTPTPAYKVEIQRTRNSKDGTNTRSYRIDYFDILAICTFNQSKQWKFYFIHVSDLETVEGNTSLLKIMQRVPLTPQNQWTDNLNALL
ncbi:MAG: hypothetical protein HZB92_02825 [Euryarchaeota archaeon]|nr:hypothetical protein [Euryarchaeota archaeon]